MVGFWFRSACDRFDPGKQTGRFRHFAFRFVAKDTLAIHEHGQIASFAGFDCWFDSEFLLCCLPQAHGCAAYVESPETTVDFNHHLDYACLTELVFCFIIPADSQQSCR
jgi:hypothetical protein